MNVDQSGNASVLSPKRLAANRINASKSTGPKTLEGKNVSRLNALTHGLLSKQLFAKEQNNAAARAEFGSILAGLAEDLKPASTAERILVERMAVAYWRLAGLLRFELTHTRRLGPLREEVPRVLQTPFDPLIQRLSIIEACQKEAQETGTLQAGSLGRLKGLPSDIFDTCKKLIVRPRQFESIIRELGERPQGREPDEQVTLADTLVRILEAEKTSILQARALAAERRSGTRDHFDTPQSDTVNFSELDLTERILRYQTTIERQFDRAMDQLERLQRRRAGEPVPPPVKATLTVEK